MTNINVHLSDGQKLQICQNYSFSRKDLYAALQRINPNIELPDKANVFKHELSREEDEYVSTRFPITTKIIKTVLKVLPKKTNSPNDKNRRG